MTTEALRRLARKWQDRLGLRDWKVEVQFWDRKQLGEFYGEVMVNRKRRVADVRVLKPKDWPKSETELDDESIERTVLHELLHVWFNPLEREDDSENEIAIEQAINALCVALLRLD
jgi:hypothetical protein